LKADASDQTPFGGPSPDQELKRLEPLPGESRSEDRTLERVLGPGVPVTSTERFYWLDGGYSPPALDGGPDSDKRKRAALVISRSLFVRSDSTTVVDRDTRVPPEGAVLARSNRRPNPGGSSRRVGPSRYSETGAQRLREGQITWTKANGSCGRRAGGTPGARWHRDRRSWLGQRCRDPLGGAEQPTASQASCRDHRGLGIGGRHPGRVGTAGAGRSPAADLPS
jgi:hypothetical protein